MTQSRKETAWKKSRKFGDVKGGRVYPKLADKIFNRQHNFLPPCDNEETPIFIVDNPSRDFYFPVSVKEIKAFLAQLPTDYTDDLTHVWLRKMKKKDYEKEGSHQGCFICGSGVKLIVLYPFSIDLKMKFGKKKPSKKILKWYSAYEPELLYENNNWLLQWTKEGIKRYYLEGLLLHEIGHKMDSFYKRYWSANYHKKAENYADNFAYYWGNQLRQQYE